jgi:SAM-dependent methyltransferase
MREVFEPIYVRNTWGSGSGWGALPKNVRPYMRFLQQFLRRKQIQSVLDVGCGDWQFSRHINWTGINYLGIDVVPDVIKNHQANYQTANVQFAVSDFLADQLPPADLLVTKDVLQHWSYDRIRSFLSRLERYDYVLITNCVNPSGPTFNVDITDGDFRYLDLNAPPFCLGAKEVLSFHGYLGESHWRVWKWRRWVKKTLLLATNRSSQ